MRGARAVLSLFVVPLGAAVANHGAAAFARAPLKLERCGPTTEQALNPSMESI